MLTTKQEFIDYCLRTLGAPVIQINLDPSQIEDAVADAILKFTEYHRDGYEEYFYTYTIPELGAGETQPNRVITIPQELQIDDVISVVPAGSPIGGRFDTYAWQAAAAITSPEINGWGYTSLQDYVAMQERISELNTVLGEQYVIKHNKYKRTIELRFTVSVGETFAFKCYKRNDPNNDDCIDAWNDQWLKEYATALIKKRWGNVLTKVSGIRLVGGIELNGSDILNSAIDEIVRLEEELKQEHQLPPEIFIG